MSALETRLVCRRSKAPFVLFFRVLCVGIIFPVRRKVVQFLLSMVCSLSSQRAVAFRGLIMLVLVFLSSPEEPRVSRAFPSAPRHWDTEPGRDELPVGAHEQWSPGAQHTLRERGQAAATRRCNLVSPLKTARLFISTALLE